MLPVSLNFVSDNHSFSGDFLYLHQILSDFSPFPPTAAVPLALNGGAFPRVARFLSLASGSGGLHFAQQLRRFDASAPLALRRHIGLGKRALSAEGAAATMLMMPRAGRAPIMMQNGRHLALIGLGRK